MTQSQIMQRIENLEREIVQLKDQLKQGPNQTRRRTSRDFIGMFRNDPVFQKVVELGTAYRRSLRPAQLRKRNA